MRKKSPTIDHKALASIGDVPKSVLTTEGKPLVPGLFARRRGSNLHWLMRYRNKGGVHRELVLGYESGFGVRGTLASAVEMATATGRALDFNAELLKAKGAKEAIPAHLIGGVAGRVHSMIDYGSDPVAERQATKVAAERAATGYQFKELAEQFLAEGVKKRGLPMRPATLKEYKRALLDYAAALHNRSVKEIEREEISDLILAVKAKHGAISATRMRAALSRLFNWLIGRGKAKYNPVTHTQVYATPRRERELSDDELRKLWAATTKPTAYHAIIRLLLWTGARPAEVGGMASAELKDGEWSFAAERAKNGRPLVLPLPRQAQAALDDWPRHDGLLFGQKPGRPFSGWSKAKHELDSVLAFDEPWQLRDLRRTVETRLASVGVSQEHINRILNHAQGPITSTYNRYAYRAEKAAALQRWADELDRIIGNPAPENVVPMQRTA